MHHTLANVVRYLGISYTEFCVNRMHSVKVARVCARSRDARGRAAVWLRAGGTQTSPTHSLKNTLIPTHLCVCFTSDMRFKAPDQQWARTRICSANKQDLCWKRDFFGSNIRVSSDVWRLISVWKTDGYIKWLNLLLFAFRIQSLSY